MLKVDGEFLAKLKTTPISELVTPLVEQQSPPREWHADKLTRFLTALQKQTTAPPTQ